MGGGVFDRGEPHARQFPSSKPFLVARDQPEDGRALLLDEVRGGRADGPPQARRHRDHLVKGVYAVRPPQPRHRLHVGESGKPGQSDGRGLEADESVEVGDDPGPVE